MKSAKKNIDERDRQLEVDREMSQTVMAQCVQMCPGRRHQWLLCKFMSRRKKKRMLRGRCEHKSCYLLRGEEIQVIEAVVDVRKFAIKNYLFVELRLLLAERRRFILFCVLPSFASTYMRYKNSKFML